MNRTKIKKLSVLPACQKKTATPFIFLSTFFDTFPYMDIPHPYTGAGIKNVNKRESRSFLASGYVKMRYLMLNNF